MPQIRFERVVSVSSEDELFPATNLLAVAGVRGWKGATAGLNELSAIVQLDESRRIDAVHIGNNGAAFVEVRVGRRTASVDDYRVLLPTASFMSPKESRDGAPTNRVRIFDSEKLDKATVSERWDCVRVVCTQPFNRRSTFGLAFIKLFSNREPLSLSTTPSSLAPSTTSEEQKNQPSVSPTASSVLGNFSVRPPSTEQFRPGQLFARQRQQKSDSTSDSVGDRQTPTRNELGGRSLKTPLADVSLPPRHSNLADNTPSSGSSSDTREAKSDNTCAARPDKKDIQPRNRVQQRPTNASQPGHSSPSSRKESPEQRRRHNPRRSAAPGTRRRLPLNRLLAGVVFTMSGYQNPRRAELRRTALKLGAVYYPDWRPQCTHLVCAFTNTPKMAQAGGRARIVRAEWLEECGTLRRRIPWRRHALLAKDRSAAESEDEIWAEEDAPPARSSVAFTSEEHNDEVEGDEDQVDVSDDDADYVVSSGDTDTDDEIRAAIGATPLARATRKRRNSSIDAHRKRAKNFVHRVKTASGDGRAQIGCSAEASPPSSNNQDGNGHLSDDDVYNARTDDDEDSRELPSQDTRLGSEIPKLPDFFSEFKFFVCKTDSTPPELVRQMNRLIVAFGGALVSRQEADFIVLADCESKRGVSEKSYAVSVRAVWLFECNTHQRLVPHSQYVVS